MLPLVLSPRIDIDTPMRFQSVPRIEYELVNVNVWAVWYEETTILPELTETKKTSKEVDTVLPQIKAPVIVPLNHTSIVKERLDGETNSNKSPVVNTTPSVSKAL